MNKDKGWILVYRSIQDHWLWEDKPFSKGQAWIDLLLLANHEDHRFMYKGEVRVAERGQLNRSVSSLAERWGWSNSKANRFFNDLKADGMVTISTDHNRTTITVENYASFQEPWKTNGQRMVNERSTSGQRVVNERKHTNNEKNSNNEKKVIGKPVQPRHVIPPTPEMVSQYCNERQNGLDASYFYDYYESRNWMLGKTKMKDWQAAVRTWEKKNFQDARDKSNDPF